MLVGLVGPSGSMKTQVAKHLENMHGFERMHMGMPVKAAVRAMTGMTKEMMGRPGKDMPTMKLGGKTPRDMMEAVGMAMHQTSPDLTANQMESRIHQAMAQGKNNIVVDGIRSPREAAMMRRMGGMIVRCDNGMEMASMAMPMDRMQNDIQQNYTLDTSGPTKMERCAKADQMLRDCMP